MRESSNITHRQRKLDKILTLPKFVRYLSRLYFGLITDRIYFDNQNVIKFYNISFDIKETLNIIDDRIRETLKNFNCDNQVIPSEQIGFEHVGYGCFGTRRFGNTMIWTQGNATFFFFTPRRENYELKVTIQTVVKNSIKIMIENHLIAEYNLFPFRKKKIILEISPSLIIHDVTKIIISNERFWSPHFVEKSQENIPLGVNIIFMQIKTKSIF